MIDKLEQEIQELQKVIDDCRAYLKRLKESPIIEYYYKKNRKKSIDYYQNYINRKEDVEMLELLLGLKKDVLKRIKVEEFQIND